MVAVPTLRYALCIQCRLPFLRRLEPPLPPLLPLPRYTPEKIAFVRVEAGTNLIGGQPFSLANLREVRQVRRCQCACGCSRRPSALRNQPLNCLNPDAAWLQTEQHAPHESTARVWVLCHLRAAACPHLCLHRRCATSTAAC